MKKTFVLIRHARQDSKACNVDVPLSVKGREQAELLGKRLEGSHFDSLYSSDLIRARETAEIVNKHINLPFTIRKELREIDYGSLTGLSVPEMYTNFEHMEDRFLCHEDYSFPGGECGEDVFKRAKVVIDEMVQSDKNRFLIITHGGTIRALVCGLLGIPMRYRLAFGVMLENTSITELEYNSDNNRFTLECFNDYSHLMVDHSLLKENW